MAEVWPSVSDGGARAWQLVEQPEVRVFLAAESVPSWDDWKQLQSWSA